MQQLINLHFVNSRLHVYICKNIIIVKCKVSTVQALTTYLGNGLFRPNEQSGSRFPWNCFCATPPTPLAPFRSWSPHDVYL